MEWISKLVEALKLSTRYSWIVVLASGALIFLPDAFLKRIHVFALRQQYESTIGAAFLLTSVMVVVELVIWGAKRVRTNRARHAQKKAAATALQQLDRREQAVLREFFIQGQHTVQLPYNNPTIMGLMRKSIIEPVGNMGEHSTAGVLFPFRIRDGVEVTYEHINLPRDQPSQQEIEFLRSERPDFIAEIESHNDLFHRSWWNRRI